MIYMFIKNIVISDRLEIVKYLVEHGANVNEEDYGKRTPVHMSAIRGMHRIIQKNCALSTIAGSSSCTIDV